MFCALSQARALASSPAATQASVRPGNAVGQPAREHAADGAETGDGDAVVTGISEPPDAPSQCSNLPYRRVLTVASL